MAYKRISPIPVNEGGSGALTLTGVLTGNGTSAFTASPVTQYGTLVASTSNLVTTIAPSATSGIPYISQGSSANPTFGTAVVAGGGTGNTTFTAYSVITAGTTATGVFQNVVGVGSLNQVLVSQGAGALPIWAAVPATSGVTSITGTANQITASASTGAVTLSIPSTFIAPGSIASTTSLTAGNLTTAGVVYNAVTTGLLSSHQTTNHNIQVGNSSGQLGDIAPSATSGIPLISQGASADPVFGTAVVAGGGTGDTSFTAFAVITGGTTSTGALQNVVGVGNTGQVLTSAGAATLPVWSNPSVAFAYTAVNAAASPYTVLSTDYYLAVDVTAGTVTINLPNVPATKTVYIIKDKVGLAASNNITVTTPGGTVTIDGSTTFVMNTAYQSINVLFDGANYQIY